MPAKSIFELPRGRQFETFNPYVFSRIGPGMRVLDVGCATGLLGKKLRESKSPRFIAGIEVDPRMADAARPYYDEVAVADIQASGSLPFKPGSFDVIVCADILEHLTDPAGALRLLVPLLAERGRLLISLPNIAFISVRLALLTGRFDYCVTGGIMDLSHLRFFTRRSARDLLESVGLKVNSITGYNLVRRRFFFLRFLGGLLPGLFCIQFIAEAQKE